ncbi:uncharacterized protein F5147DRAFT_802693 [Suillus discolor]|uniref:Uncharacterized protein n=1 Tax=Suillus discolor TaxID=1912936 RepID=A0A9P7F6Y0_9AGAM|nr:uncharacterized protein F5147DRAFT_802693 [Suillus discolor]KAG2107498.1 hypothetical protein F5147DRAFT_802693 [Suillus discolor]
MACTKQTASNSTGGPTKCGHLPIFKKVTGHARKQLIKTVQAMPPHMKIVLKPNSHNMGGAMKPYFVFENASGQGVLPTPVTIHGHIEVTSRSQICSSPVLILHFVIKGLDPSGSPATSMQQQLRPFKPQNNMQYHEIIFDIGTGKKAKKHLTMMKQLVTQIKLLQCERVKVFIFSHSSTMEGSQGDIWGGYADNESSGRGRNKVVIKGGPVAYTVNNFFAGLFVSGIEDYVKGSTLWMFVCGHMVQEPDTFGAFKACVKEYEVEHAFAFGAERFHACLVVPFISTYVGRVLVEGFEVQDVI